MTEYEAFWPSGVHVKWRGLTWKEFRTLRQHPGPEAATFLEVYRLCRRLGPPISLVTAGVVSFVGRHQLSNENTVFGGDFRPIQNSLERYRKELMTNYLEAARSSIAGILHIPFPEIDEMDSDTFMQRVAQVEFVLQLPHTLAMPDMEPFKLNPSDPKAPVKPRSSRKR